LDEGGLEEVVTQLAAGLSSHGMVTGVLCTHGGGARVAPLRARGIPVTVCKGRPRGWHAWLRDFRPDVLSTHYVPLDVAAALAEGGVRLVETVHNMYAWYGPREWSDEREKCAIVSHLTPVSEMVAEYHRRACGGHPSTTVIPNGVSGAGILTVPRDDARRRLGFEAEEMVFVQVGRFCPQKNQLGLVDVLADILDREARIRILLVGGQEDEAYVARVVKRAGGLVDRGAVRVMAATPDVGLILSAADAFIANSYFEGWSLAATEALWVGRPVILSDCGGASELVGPSGERGVLIPNPGGDPLSVRLSHLSSTSPIASPTNRQAIQDAVLQVMANRDDWLTRSDRIRTEARRRWPSEVMVERHAAVLSHVAGR
jgi:glycosyltransferase involved in cell wall biosynthesis